MGNGQIVFLNGDQLHPPNVLMVVPSVPIGWSDFGQEAVHIRTTELKRL
jgi:hypothetical protein